MVKSYGKEKKRLQNLNQTEIAGRIPKTFLSGSSLKGYQDTHHRN